MTKILASTFLFIVFHFATAQQHQAFDYLDEIKVTDFPDQALFLFEKQSEIINLKRSELPQTHLFYAEECLENSILIAYVPIEKGSDKKYAVTLEICPNRKFVVYDVEASAKPIGSFNADQVYINGTAKLYTAGGVGTFDARRKFTLVDGKFEEMVQPYYYVGLKTKTLNAVELYGSDALEKSVATLPADYEIEILLSKNVFNDKEGIYLVKTSFGLVGWAKLRSGQQVSVDAEGLIYNGD